jgi:hypothetical protein
LKKRLSKKTQLLIAVIFAVLIVAAYQGPIAENDFLSVISDQVFDVRTNDKNSHGIDENAEPALSLTNAVENPDHEPELFHDVDEAMLDKAILQKFLQERPVHRYRVVTIDSDSIRSIIRDEYNDLLPLNLFDDTKLVSYASSKEDWLTGVRTCISRWSGGIIGEEYGSVVLVIDANGMIEGTIRTSDGYYRITRAGRSPYQFIWQIVPGYTETID